MLLGILTLLCIGINWHDSGIENVKKNWYVYCMSTLFAVDQIIGSFN